MSFASWLYRSNRNAPRTRRPAAARARLEIESLEQRLVLNGYSPPAAGLVAWWSGNGNANDLAGGHNGTLVSGTYGPGILGADQAFRLNGSSDYVQVPDDPAWNLGSNDFTVDLWVNYSALRSDSIVHPQSIFAAHDEGPGNSNKWFFAYGGGELFWHINSPSTGPVVVAPASFSPNLNQWYNVAVTRAGSTYTIYVNGTAVSSENNALPVPDANAPLTLGEGESPPGDFFMNGSMEHVLLYNRALGASELAGLTNPQSSLALKASANPAVLGQSVTFTATVSNSFATPAGGVDFVDTTTGTDLGTVPLASDGTASVTVPNLVAGSHVIKAVYAGQGIVQGSNSTLTEQVGFHFSGFLPPLGKTSTFRVGRTIPIKFQLTDAAGNFLGGLGNVQSLTANGVTLYAGATGAGPAGAPGQGLHYDPNTHDFVFDWSTKGLKAGTYTITLQLADGTSHAVTVQLSKSSCGDRDKDTDDGGDRDHDGGHRDGHRDSDDSSHDADDPATGSGGTGGGTGQPHAPPDVHSHSHHRRKH
jgi:hypothetical protein